MGAKDKKQYTKRGVHLKRSEEREATGPGKLAAAAIDLIPKDYDIYKEHTLTEESLANEIVKGCGRYIRHCPATGWLAWNKESGCWQERGAESAVNRIIFHFGHLLEEGSTGLRKEEDQHIMRVMSAGGVTAIKTILKNHTKIHTEQEAFDADGEVVNCQGELWNLREGVCRPTEPEDYVTKTTRCKAAAFKSGEEPGIPAKLGEFLRKVTSKDGAERHDLAFYIMYWFGYCLTGDTGAGFLVNFHGQGNNGKSVLLKLMTELFGDYAAPMPKDLVIENRFEGQFDLAALPGIRLAVLADAKEGRLNMDALKPIITGDTQNAKRKFLKDFPFKPVCKIAVGSNPKLTLRDTGVAVRRRIRMVPFEWSVPENEVVNNLERQLLEEGPEILAHLICLARDYYKSGGGPKAFPPCEAVDEASREYLESEDMVGRFVKERTESAPENAVSAKELYNEYKKWSEDEGIRKPHGPSRFGEYVSLHLKNKKRTNAGIVYLDIRIKGGSTDLPGDGGG